MVTIELLRAGSLDVVATFVSRADVIPPAGATVLVGDDSFEIADTARAVYDYTADGELTVRLVAYRHRPARPDVSIVPS